MGGGQGQCHGQPRPVSEPCLPCMRVGEAGRCCGHALNLSGLAQHGVCLAHMAHRGQGEPPGSCPLTEAGPCGSGGGSTAWGEAQVAVEGKGAYGRSRGFSRAQPRHSLCPAPGHGSGPAMRPCLAAGGWRMQGDPRPWRAVDMSTLLAQVGFRSPRSRGSGMGRGPCDGVPGIRPRRG